MKRIQNILIIGLMFTYSSINASEVKIKSLHELAEYASKSGNVIRMSPGVYRLLTIKWLIQ